MTGTQTLLAGRYRLGGALGRGGMATVHRADDLVLERQVAVKVFAPEAAEPGRAVSYEQEARILAGLSHPGLVTVFDAGIDATTPDGSRAFLVMELVEGVTLADLLRDGPLPPQQVAHFGSQIATALAYVHRKGVVHRDIKPANILLAEDDDPGTRPCAKLTDFGIARLVDSARMTADGLTVGTAAYLSPEQVGGGAIEAPSDVYSLGLVLLEALTGQVAFPGDSVAAATERLRRDPVIPPWLDAAWVRVLCSMFERDPAARPAAAEVAVALTGLAVTPTPAAPAAETDAVATTALPVVDDDAARPVDAPHATRVMEVPPEAVESAPQLQQMETPARSGGAVRRIPRRVLAVLAALAVLVVVLVIVLSTRGSTNPPVPVRKYPAVPGQLGTDLQKLQQQVQP